MSEPSTVRDTIVPKARADLEAVLAAWHTATLRLEQTHATLREEVRRLTNELEVKNRELARKNRMADLGQMAAHVAHEVRNNLVPVTLYLSLLRRRISDDPGSLDVLDKIGIGFTELDSTINDLLHFTSDRDPCLKTFSLQRMADGVLLSLGAQLSAQSIETMVDVPADMIVTADEDMLSRAVLNLILNALDAMPDGGSLCVTAAWTAAGFELEIADSGAGLSDDAKTRAFEPFFATKLGRAGLGLAIVYRITEVHGGDCTAVNCPEGGAAFTLRIPQATVLKAAA